MTEPELLKRIEVLELEKKTLTDAIERQNQFVATSQANFNESTRRVSEQCDSLLAESVRLKNQLHKSDRLCASLSSELSRELAVSVDLRSSNENLVKRLRRVARKCKPPAIREAPRVVRESLPTFLL